ncbi:hypothetical protein [Microbacterium luticocti]|uniref:hypothetical protein n=1 Tax=Microbacterium luticocti TaxID=451764 RepID=UPI0004143C97|nr:hypothetical protein [Microbacterium luticocti]
MTDEKLNGPDPDDLAHTRARADEYAVDDTVPRASIAADPTAGNPPAEAQAAESASQPADATEPGDQAASGDGADEAVPVQYGVGPFSLREVILAGIWLVAFVVSFFSTSSYVFTSVFTRGIDWILTIGVPTVAVFLIVLRRLSPSGIRRVGSLGIDQFASVGFSVSAVVWLGQLWSQVSVAVSGGPWVLSWVPWVEFVLMLAGVVATVFAVLVPGLADDFRHRPETVAHRAARPARPVAVRPRPVPAPAAEPVAAPTAAAGAHDPAAGEPAAYEPAAYEPTAPEPTDDRTHAVPVVAPASPQPFWALVPEDRDVVDDHGVPLFRIGPTAWALVIEDRGSVFVVRHEDGRVGYLHDTSGVTRG